MKWKLYWVESDGYEDCFVVAKNSRSAKSVEVHMNGFNMSDVTAVRVMDVPDIFEKKADKKYRKWSKKHAPQQANRPDLHQWPWYAAKWLLKDLGAQFRIIDDEEQTLLRDVVYAKKAIGVWYTYSIGARALSERNERLPIYENYEKEPEIDNYKKSNRKNILTDWGQRELLAFLDLFLSLCIPIETIAASCFEISIVFGNTCLLDINAEKFPIESSEELLGLFISSFKLKSLLWKMNSCFVELIYDTNIGQSIEWQPR
ncbi:hypothetical protein ABEW34_13930 [Paenibacillus algorifonticola]|uniref:hypothetical protein n=1 Tax=Paenibacillus algorifonticola TaxID=684063 RepID=UPI003D2DD315